MNKGEVTGRVAIVLLALSFTFPVPLNLRGDAVQSPRVVLTPAPSATKIIHKWADYYGVDKDLAVRIAFAESGLNCSVQNKSSSAGGLFQFINSTFLNTQKRLGKPQDISRKYDCDENAELGIYLLSRGELQHWNASRLVWDRSSFTSTPRQSLAPRRPEFAVGDGQAVLLGQEPVQTDPTTADPS
jgi:hypothetical protein